MIPSIRINYSILHLLEAIFVTGKTEKYRNNLKKSICEYFNVGNVILTSSGRSAIYMIVKALPQNKVVIPAYTCEVVEEAVKLAGKSILYAHVNKDTLNILKYPTIDSDTIVIATHQYGLPCEMKSLTKLCKEKGAVLIEDCAGSLGSKIDNKLTGTFGDFGIFSFSASKTLHSPTKGGFIIAKDAGLLSNIEKRYQLNEDSPSFKIRQLLKGIGFCLNNNSFFCTLLSKSLRNKRTHLSNNTINSNKNINYIDKSIYQHGFYEWQAYVVCKQFDIIKCFLEKRKEMARIYEKELRNCNISKPVFCENAVNIRYAILVKDRRHFIEYCKSKGIQVGMGYRKSICPEDYLEEKELYSHIVYLPFGSKYNMKEIRKIISTINDYS